VGGGESRGGERWRGKPSGTGSGGGTINPNSQYIWKSIIRLSGHVWGSVFSEVGIIGCAPRLVN